MNPRGPPGTPMDIETFPQNSQIKSMERTLFQSLTLTLKIMRKQSDKLFFFLFFSNTWIFSEKLAKVSSIFRTFPNLQNLRKHLKAFQIFQFFNYSTSVLGLLVHNPIKHNIYIYIYLFISIIKTFETSSNPCICFYQKIGFEPDLSRPPTYLVN